MATVDELIEQNQLKATPAAAEPEGGLLSRIESFIGGSTRPDTLDATGLTQADRRQSLFAGLTDIGAKLMAAGEPMWGHQRAQYLAGLGQVPANMQQMRSGIAQQKLLGVKSAQAMREMQVQREMDAVARDPNHPIWQQFPAGQDRALAQWAMRTGGPKAFMEYLAHKDDAAYKKNLAIKALADADKTRAETAGLIAADKASQGLLGGTPPPAAPPPAAVPPTGQPSAAVDPTDPATGVVGPMSGAVADAGGAPPLVTAGGSPVDPNSPPPAFMAGSQAAPALTPPQQVLAANQPPTVQPTPAAGAILQGMQGAGGGGAQVAEAPTATPVVPTQAPVVPGVPTGPAGGQPTKPVELPPGYGVPRTVEDVAKHLTPAQRQSLLAMWPPQKRLEELQKYLNPDTKPVFHIPSGQILFVNKNAPPHPDFAPKEELDRRTKMQELAQKAINDHVVIDQQTGEAKVNEVAARAQYERDVKKAEAEAKAQQTDRLRQTQETQAQTSQAQADTAARAQAVTATEKGQTATGQYDPKILEQQQEQKRQEAAMKADVEIRKEAAQSDYKNYGDPDKGSLAIVRGANKMLPLIYQAEEYRKAGMLTGSFPETRMMLNRMRATMGLTGDVSQDQINRTGYNNVVGRMMIEGLSAGRPLGSQVSDADREAMKELTGLGSYGDKEIAELMDIAERTAKGAFERHQETVSSLSRKHPSLKDILAVDADIKPVDRETWTQQYRNEQEERRRKSEDPLRKRY